MLRGFGLGGKKSETAAAADAAPAAGTAAGPCGSDLPTKILLVIDAGKEKWADIFDNAVIRLPTSRSRPAAAAGAGCGARSTGTTAGAGAGSGSGSGSQRSSSATDAAFAERTYRVEVVQTAWDKMNLAAYSSGGAFVNVETVQHVGEHRVSRTRCIKPDFLLIRNECRGVQPGQDKRHLLYGLYYGLVGSVNSMQSIVMMAERPLAHAELLRIQRRLGKEVFPVVDQTYYPNSQEMIISPDMPVVVKVGHAHAGYGKMIIRDAHQFEDFSSVMAVTSTYCTAESYIPGEYDLRIQKIGNHYRAFKRQSVSGTWKTNTGTSVVEDIEMTPQYKLWADECSKCFGGMDIVTVDGIHSREDGKEYILEMNGTSSGFSPDHAAEDNIHVRDLVLKRMEEALAAM